MLSVEGFKAGHARSTERAVESNVAGRLKNAGIYSRHMSDSVPGLPDRYVRGGNWIEFKSLWRVRGGFKFGEGLSTEQWRCGADLEAAGDRVFYFAQVDGSEVGKRFVFVSFSLVLERRDQVIPVSFMQPYTALNARIRETFLEHE